MLYVFHVENGTMLSFDMNLALENVERLKQEIMKEIGLVLEKQVLLISGGESLNPAVKVCCYSVGTDTNPIYLCSTYSSQEYEATLGQTVDLTPVYKDDFKFRVEGQVDMTPSIHAVASRVQLAIEFHDAAREVVRACDKLVHEQHMQQQGWAAVVANLEDITSSFEARVDIIDQSFNTYYDKRSKLTSLLESYNRDLELAQMIPLIKFLRDLPEFNSILPPSESAESDRPLTLLEWMDYADMRSDIDIVPQQSAKLFEQYNKGFHAMVMNEAGKFLKEIATTDVKEVRGLGERLCGLEQLMCDARKYAQEQADICQAFLQQQTRLGNMNDLSILPDLCESHRKQLDVMLKNDYHLKEIYRRCIIAKFELSNNFRYRLVGITYLEQKMVMIGEKLSIYHGKLKNLKLSLDIVEQIHLAPTVYLLAVAEIIRRKSFTTDYLKWTRETSQQANIVYQAEVTSRNEFMFKVGNHFLKPYFPGLDGLPSEYGLSAPDNYDTDLPEVESSYIELLRGLLPKFAKYLDADSMQKLTSALQLQECPIARDVFVSAIDGVHSLMRGDSCAQVNPTVESPDDKDPESEPDTEEFEKVEQCTVLTDAVVGESMKSDDVASKIKAMQLENVFAGIREHQVLLSNFRSDLTGIKDMFSNREDDLKKMTTDMACQVTDKAKDILENKNSEMVQFKRAILHVVQQKYMKEIESVSNSGLNMVFQRHGSSLLNLESKIKNCDSKVELLNKQLAAKTASFRQMTLEHELDLVNLREEHSIESAAFEKRISELLVMLEDKSEEIIKIKEALAEAERIWQQRLEEAVKDLELHRDCIEKEKNKLLAKLEEAEAHNENELRRIISESESRHQTDKIAIEERFSRRISEMENEKDTALKQLKETLTKAHQIEMETLKPSSMDRSPSDGSLEKIERPESTELLMLEQQIVQLRAELQEKATILDRTQRLHEEEMKELKDQSEKAQENALRTFKTNLTAEQQILFNEAVNRIAAEKDKIIQDRELQIAALSRDNELKEPTSPTSPSIDLRRSVMERSVSGSLAESVFVTSVNEQSTMTIKNEASTSTVPVADCCDKISFLTCAVGDLVLLTYDHKLENYLAFTTSSTLYFLNTDCWEDFGIKKESAESKKNWIIGRVIDKEYCQAKKKNNRFNVAVGAKFYRIKVKPWSLDSSSKLGMSSSVHSVKEAGVSHKTSQT